jgi:hypothetical protein
MILFFLKKGGNKVMDSSKIALLVFITLILGITTLFIIDKPPILEKTKGPSGEISKMMSSFSWNGEDPDGRIIKYEYRKDGGKWIGVGDSTRYIWVGYSEGEHTFEVRARDNNGKTSEIVSWTFFYKPNP